MRIYVDNLEPDLVVTLCDSDPLDLTDPSIGLRVEAYQDFFYDELLWTAVIAPSERSLVDGCTVLTKEWVVGETADRPWWTYHRQAIKAVILWPPDDEEQEIRMLRTVKVRS